MANRMAICGKEPQYLGVKLGTVYVDRVEVKGSPTVWVDEAMTNHTKEQLALIIGRLAANEAALHPFRDSGKMGRTTFWRNAKAYFAKKVKA